MICLASELLLPFTKKLPPWFLAGICLTAKALAQPVNDAFAQATALTNLPFTATASTVGATREPGEPYHAGNSGGHSVWWRWQSPFTGRVIAHTSGSSFDTLLAVYRGSTVNQLALVAANDDDPFGLDVETSRVWFEAEAGTNYHLVVDGWSGDAGSLNLQVLEPPRPANDAFDHRSLLGNDNPQVVASNVDATREPGDLLQHIGLGF
jgi:hypothetical protein